MLNDFVLEALESLDNIKIGVAELEDERYKSEIINGIFRTCHTIKGVSGFLGFDMINRLARSMENLLEDLRKNILQVTPSLMDLLLEAVDLLKKTLVVAVNQSGADPIDLEHIGHMQAVMMKMASRCGMRDAGYGIKSKV